MAAASLSFSRALSLALALSSSSAVSLGVSAVECFCSLLAAALLASLAFVSFHLLQPINLHKKIIIKR